VSLRDNRFSPLYRPSQAFRDPGRAGVVTFAGITVCVVGLIVLQATSSHAAHVIAIIAMVGGGLAGGLGQTILQVRAVNQRIREHDERERQE
jgi:hypothetical protein